MRIADALQQAASRLGGVSQSPRLDAEVLLAHCLSRTRSSLFAYADDAVEPAAGERFEQLIAARAGGQPVAYLLGRWEFWSLSLQVNPAVLVPRADTECLVEWALELPLPADACVADLGTGSGAIALALAHERPGWQLRATDLSPAALAVAQANALDHGLHRIQFSCGRWCAALPAQAELHLIVANPPYLAASDPHLPMLHAEPAQALIAGPQGLEDLAELSAHAGRYLRAGGHLLLEHGHEQGAAVRALLAQAGYADVHSRRDYGGHERVSGGRKL